MSSLPELTARFPVPGLSFHSGPGGLINLHVETEACSGRMLLHGAHVLAWEPRGERAVFWVSRKTPFQEGKAVRGGIPLCWPWFGKKADGLPMHGFVRTRVFELRQAERQGDDLLLVLGTKDDADTLALWPHAFDFEVRVRFGREFSMESRVLNKGKDPFSFTGAFHPYLSVGHAADCRVSGLDGGSYLDRRDAEKIKKQQGDVTFGPAVDRLFTHQGDAVLHDPTWKRNLRTRKTGSLSTVVWNPDAEVGKSLPDFGAHEGEAFVCVEAANGGENHVTVAPGATHVTSFQLFVEGLS